MNNNPQVYAKEYSYRLHTSKGHPHYQMSENSF